MSNKRTDNFSVGLGLFDYINPIFYGVTTVTLALNLFDRMSPVVFLVFLSGGALLFTVFPLPTWAVLCIAAGSAALLALAYAKKKKFNTVAVLLGAFGYGMIYSSLITFAVTEGRFLSVALGTLLVFGVL